LTTFRDNVLLAADPGHLVFAAMDTFLVQDSPGLHGAAMTAMPFMHRLNML
jgi:hypothetical protein